MATNKRRHHIPVVYTPKERLDLARVRITQIPRPKGIKGFVWNWIVKRIDEVVANSELIEKEPKTLNDINYDTFDPLQAAGYDVDKLTRKQAERRRETIQNKYPRQICDKLGIKRSDIGLITGEVAHMYFRGQHYPINLDKLTSLKYKGPFIIIIEKQGIAEQLKFYAKPYAISLVHTRGFLTEYAEDLSELANSNGGRIVILTDDDISGRLIAHKVPNVPRIGIDVNTLKDLNIYDRLDELIEEKRPDKHHLKHIERYYPNDLENVGFDLRHKRIELNKLRNMVGSERFWKWILSKLIELFDNVDMNRGVYTPTANKFRPEPLDVLNDIVDRGISEIIDPEIQSRKAMLRHYRIKEVGFIEDVTQYEREMRDEFQVLVDEHARIGPIIDDIEEILRRHGYA